MSEDLTIVPTEVGELQDAIDLATAKVMDAMEAVQEAISAVVRAGQLLRDQRERIGHGGWYAWLDEQHLSISRETARKWIRLAEFEETHAERLAEAQTIRQAYVLAGLLPETESNPHASSGPNIIATLIKSTNHLSARIASRPIEKWSEHERLEVKTRLRPLVEIYERL